MILVRKACSLLRQADLWLRSAIKRTWLRLAFVGIECHPSVQFGRGVVIRATDGGRIRIGAGSFIHGPSLIVAEGGTLTIGRDCHIGMGTVIACGSGITIGDGVQIAEHVSIRDQDHNWRGEGALAEKGFSHSPIAIGSDVWLAAKVTVTRGVTIAPRVVVGANSMVTRSLEVPGAYAGAPARPLGGPRAPADSAAATAIAPPLSAD